MRFHRFSSHSPVFGAARAIFAIGLMAASLPTMAEDTWRPAGGKISTRWAAKVDPRNPLPEYPRPQMRRKAWQSLNGLWDYAITPKGEGRPTRWDGKILVPFCAESSLSGVRRMVGPDYALWYRRTFETPAGWSKERLILHFGAVDWEAQVWVNGKPVGSHKGGYDPFSLDVTSALMSSGPQEVVVRVWDPSDSGTQPRGKQVRKPEGIWYTPVTGIWQTVWIEPVASAAITSLRITPDLDGSKVSVKAQCQFTDALDSRNVTVVVSGAGASATGTSGESVNLKVSNPRVWSPDDPHLYDLTVSLKVNGKTVDTVQSYFGMRKISLGKDDRGFTRILLNNKALFQFGPLDQGFWPDGIYTAPTDEALRYDIEMTKKLGFNMARKHVKVEPARWYYWADKLGLIVWQDMPSGDRYISGAMPDITRSKDSSDQYHIELGAIMDALHNSPAIVMWVPFNEGWGQFDTGRVAKWVKERDPSRLVNSASGWTDRGVGDMMDIHVYPGPAAPKPEEKRAVVLGEYGGLGLPLKGHTWQDEANWGYRSYKSPEELTDAFLMLNAKLRPLIGSNGLSAAVYTQTTDVEIEVNGLMTYDRAVMKMPLEIIAAANRKLYLPAPEVHEVASTAITSPREWRYTFEKPVDEWFAETFNAAAWKSGASGFGTPDTPGTRVRTVWNTPDIWARTIISLVALKPNEEFALKIHHDEDAEVYINGVLAAKVTGYTTDYGIVPISVVAQKAIRAGNNVVAVHCRQTGGGQYIDLGIVRVRER